MSEVRSDVIEAMALRHYGPNWWTLDDTFKERWRQRHIAPLADVGMAAVRSRLRAEGFDEAADWLDNTR